MRQTQRFQLVICLAFLACALVASLSVGAQSDSLSIARIWDSDEFQARGVTQIRWLDDVSYTTLEESPSARGARDLVRHDAATGNSVVLVAASALTPPGA